MKKPTLLLILLFFSINTGISGDKKELEWRKFDAGLKEAEKTKKKVLIDVYATWCKWCKKLDAEVYTDSNVVSYINKYFIPVKMNGESRNKAAYRGINYTEADLSKAFGVTGFPTIIFLEPNGDAINKLASFVPADRFLLIIEYIGGEHYKKNVSWEDFLTKKGVSGEKLR